jgi:hypothetical protein
MSCFWDALIQRLHEIHVIPPGTTPHRLAMLLREKNVKTVGVKWQGSHISEQQMAENFHHVKDYNVNTINNGYDCSTCDPFLLLVSEVFKVNIHHTYLNTPIHYTRACTCREFPTMRFASSSSHFSTA